MKTENHTPRLNFTADSGKLIAIVARRAGKRLSSIADAVYDINEGSITVDGHDIRDVTRASLRRAYTMVLQDTWLFHGTIFENIAYGKDGATLAEVEAAAKAAKIDGY